MGPAPVGLNMPDTVIVKTLSRKCFNVEVTRPSSVSDVKLQLESMGVCDPIATDLVFQGKILDNKHVIDENICSGFLVLIENKDRGKPRHNTKKETPSSFGQKPEAPNLHSAEGTADSTFWTGHCTLRVGDPCEAAWPSPDMSSLNWFAATVLSIDQKANAATVKWSDGTHTKGVAYRYIRAVTHHEAETVGHVDLPSGDLCVPPAEEATRLLTIALEDPQFQEFLNSGLFAEIFAPLKEMIAAQPHLVPEMVEKMQESNPDMAAMVVPFLLAELETHNPELATAMEVSISK